MQLLVLGAGGQLGREFQYLQGQLAGRWQFADRGLLDLLRPDEIGKVIKKMRPDVLINCAAYTAVDRAEEEREEAAAVNTAAVEQMARACLTTDTHLIHFSTDYVYRDTYNRPLRETDITDPINYYGQTKLEGETAIRSVLPGATIIRTSWVYSAYGHNFVRTMLKLGKERDELKVVSDQIGSPTYARDLAGTIIGILQRVAQGELEPERLGGLYNFSNEGACSWYDLAVATHEIAGIDCRIEPIRSESYPTPARRPHYSVLDKHHIRTTFGLEIRHWRAALKEMLQEGNF